MMQDITAGTDENIDDISLQSAGDTGDTREYTAYSYCGSQSVRCKGSVLGCVNERGLQLPARRFAFIDFDRRVFAGLYRIAHIHQTRQIAQ